MVGINFYECQVANLLNVVDWCMCAVFCGSQDCIECQMFVLHPPVQFIISFKCSVVVRIGHAERAGFQFSRTSSVCIMYSDGCDGYKFMTRLQPAQP